MTPSAGPWLEPADGRDNLFGHQLQRTKGTGTDNCAVQCSRRTSSLCANSSESKILHESAYLATRRSVFFSPAPPIRIGGCGPLNAWGQLNVRSSR